MRGKYHVVGLDEVGRGPLAGPVTVAAVLIKKPKSFLGLKDSKKLSERQRNAWFEKMRREKDADYSVANVYEKTIDRVNVSEAANRAATRALENLIRRSAIGKKPLHIYLDGGLYLKNPRIANAYYAKTIVKGDEKINAIKLASIVAKVKRDAIMKRLHKTYPLFGFGNHKGYGTKAHFAALRRYGVTPIHRLTFLKKFPKLVSGKAFSKEA